MKEIALTQNKVALVDDKDFEFLNHFKWFAMKDGGTYYAGRVTSRKLGKQKIIRLHRDILGLVDSKILCDHIDHDGLNNQRSNLRVASCSQNSANKQSRKNSTSKFLGVCLPTNRNKWVASIRSNKKTKDLGHFKTENEAALAYNIAAKTNFGEFANLNVL